MENGLCGAGAVLFIYGLLSLYRLTRWARARSATTDPADHASGSTLRRYLGRHGEFGACGLLLAVTTGGFLLVLRAFLSAAGVDPGGPLVVGIALALGVLATAACTQALVELARARERCADLEAATLGALRKIAALDAARRTSELCLARALREKEEAEAREAAEREAREFELRALESATRRGASDAPRAIPS